MTGLPHHLLRRAEHNLLWCGIPTAVSSGHLVPSNLGLAYCLLVETYPFPELALYFRTMHFEHPSVLDFAPY